MFYVRSAAAAALSVLALSAFLIVPTVKPSAELATQGVHQPLVSQTITFSVPDQLAMPGFPQWTAVMARSWARDSGSDELCSARMGQPCRLSHWRYFLDSLRGKDPVSQLQRVNRFINQIRYQADEVTWGQIDYWAAPGKFFAIGGDCEDFAIAKFYSMKDLGFPADAMRIVVLRDTNRSLMHAVLVVTWEGREWVLDNLSDSIVSWADRHHYEPIYSINEARYNLHQDRQITTRYAVAAGN